MKLDESALALFPVDGHQFDTLLGPWTARLLPGSGIPFRTGYNDQLCLRLVFLSSQGQPDRHLLLKLSVFGLHNDPQGDYRKQACLIIEDWLRSGNERSEVEFFGQQP